MFLLSELVSGRLSGNWRQPPSDESCIVCNNINNIKLYDMGDVVKLVTFIITSGPAPHERSKYFLVEGISDPTLKSQ
jgi:hypothetical protein